MSTIFKRFSPHSHLYVKKWRKFLDFIGDKQKPDETDFLQYFDNLHNNTKFKASSTWTTYSMLNVMFQQEFGEKLQNYPRVTQLLKSYNADYVRKVASVHEKEHIDAYLSLEDNSPLF